MKARAQYYTLLGKSNGQMKLRVKEEEEITSISHLTDLVKLFLENNYYIDNLKTIFKDSKELKELEILYQNAIYICVS